MPPKWDVKARGLRGDLARVHEAMRSAAQIMDRGALLLAGIPTFSRQKKEVRDELAGLLVETAALLRRLRAAQRRRKA